MYRQWSRYGAFPWNDRGEYRQKAPYPSMGL